MLVSEKQSNVEEVCFVFFFPCHFCKAGEDLMRVLTKELRAGELGKLFCNYDQVGTFHSAHIDLQG